MVRNYVRRTTRQSWDESAMKNAVEAVINKEMGFKKASKNFNVPASTLRDRVKKVKDGLKDIENSGSKGLGNFKTVFTKEQEKEMVDHILQLESRLFPITVKDLREIAFHLAEKNNIKHDFDKEIGMAGYTWVEKFLKRNPIITLRKPEGTSGARAMGFNRVSVGNFFALLTETMDKHNLSPEQIYNVDETGISTVPKKVSKVLARKGKAQVGCLTSAERGKTITVEICMSASGHYIPPLFVFPRVRAPKNLNILERAPPGSVATYHPSGWMQTDIFLTWFDHFLSHTKPTKEKPILLLLDGHSTHTKNLAFINKARENHVIVICFPPHCSHNIQPLDVGLMAPLSQYYSNEVKKWLRKNYPRMVTELQVPELFGMAYMQAAVMLTAVNSFRATGIYPLNADVFEDWRFEPAETTNRPDAPELQATIENAAVAETSRLPRVENNHESDSQDTNASDSIMPPFILDDLAISCSSPPNSNYPLNADVFEDWRFEPAETTNRPDSPELQATVKNAALTETSRLPLVEDDHDSDSQDTNASDSIVPPFNSENLAISQDDEIACASSSHSIHQTEPITSEHNIASSPPHSESAPKSTQHHSPQPSTSTFKFTSPRDLVKLPDRGRPITSRQTKRKGKTAILTGSPYKLALEAAFTEREFKTKALGVPKGKGKGKKTPLTTNKLKEKKTLETTTNKILKRKKTQAGKKSIKKAKRDSEDEYKDDEDDDNACIFCLETYSKSKSTDGWVKCTKCPGWAHDACAGIDEEDDFEYVCDFCQ